MNLFWGLGLPGGLIVGLLLLLRTAKHLKFFSRVSRDLDQIDIANEVREVRIRELEMLMSAEADTFFRDEVNLTRRQQREGVSRRVREIRKWLHFMIANAALFEQVARFRMAGIAEQDVELEAGDPDSPYKLMDRASMVHFMATVCLGRLAVVELRRSIWPIYVPSLAGELRVAGCDLIVWYRHLMREILELAQEYDEKHEGLYERFTLQLTGTCTIEHAVELNRI